MIPLASARVNVGVSRTEVEGDIGGAVSEDSLGETTGRLVGLNGCDGPTFSDMDRALLDRTEAVGDDRWVEGFPSSSSAIPKSASVTSALSRLLTGTTVWVDCRDSAVETGREARVADAAPGRCCVIVASLRLQASLESLLSPSLSLSFSFSFSLSRSFSRSFSLSAAAPSSSCLIMKLTADETPGVMGMMEPRYAVVVGIGGGGGMGRLAPCSEDGLGGGVGATGDRPSLGFLPLKAWATWRVSCRGPLCREACWDEPTPAISSDFFLRAANARLSLEPVAAAT